MQELYALRIVIPVSATRGARGTLLAEAWGCAGRDPECALGPPHPRPQIEMLPV